ncbi:O-antigen ligase family protein [Ornithinimicrobium pratense]|uniref:O-antigen ligase family protein n=1 Tax=Ornithinimicrobium pratense TaxID=2593973 RepID=A0A5J6V988_9MICO|nr:O-antigen ligase family protein [Ornithinimicrobium pratense]QFG69756.1 O-antigen ligase family protein [Ornithinimicrobium pratense]
MPIVVPVTFVTVLYVTLLAGETVIAGMPLRLLGTSAVMVGSLALTVLPPRGRVWSGLPWFVTWVGLVALSAYWAPLDARPGRFLVDLVYLMVLTVCAAWVAPRLPDRAIASIWGLTWLIGILFASAALTGVGGDIDLQGRRSAFGMGPNVFVRVVGLGAIAAVALAWGGRKWVIWTVPVFLAAAVLSGSRGGTLAIAVAGAVIIALGLSGRTRNERRNTLLGLTLVIAVIYLVVWPRVEQWVEVRFVDTIASGYSAGRDVILSQVLELWAENSLIGVGLDGYWGEAGYRYGLQHPHNLILQTFAEAGLLAGLTLLALLLVGLRSAWSLRGGRHSLFACAAILLIVASMFSGTWYDSRFIWLFLIFGAESLSRRVVDPEPNGELGPNTDNAPRRLGPRSHIVSGGRR